MSSLAETYALAAGVKIGQPSILEKFFPLEHDLSKVILVHASAGNNNFPAKIYDYFNQVVMLIRPALDVAGYRIYQIGGNGEAPLKGVTSICGTTTMHQTAYLLKRCALFFGNDSINAHLAGIFKIPTVAVYGPTDVKNHGPYWKGYKTILIESHRFGAKRASYSAQEGQKTINQIPPEQIANAILKLLDLELVTRKSLFFGEHFMHTVLDVVPDMVVDPNFAKDGIVNIRMDYHHDEEFLKKNLSVRKCVVIFDKPINLYIFKQYRQNVVGLKCKISESFPKWTIRDIKHLGIQHVFYTENLNKETIDRMRLDYFDYCFFDNYQDKTKAEFETAVAKYLNKKLDEPINYDRLWFESNKYIISSKGAFISKAAFDAGTPIENFDFSHQKITDTPAFWNEQQHFYIYEKNQ